MDLEQKRKQGRPRTAIKTSELDILKGLVQADPGISLRAIAEAMGIHRRKVIRTLNKLIAEGKLVREGNGPGAVYKIKDSEK